jgi:hypothetical protein
MRKLVFALGTAVASLIAVTAVTVPASAFGTPAPAGLSADAQNAAQGLTQDVAWVCRYGYGGRRCFWRPGYAYGGYGYGAYGYAPGYYGYARPYRWGGYYRPYRRWGW